MKCKASVPNTAVTECKPSDAKSTSDLVEGVAPKMEGNAKLTRDGSKKKVVPSFWTRLWESFKELFS